MPRNVLVAQSGGPSPVINNTLRGIIDACRALPETFGTVYAGWHGIEGVLKEELLDLSAQPEEELRLLRTTPAAGAIGTCRYKLRDAQHEDFARVLAVCAAHDIGHFLYIGGNDSMHTAHQVSRQARQRGVELIAVGVPKTIDNDLGDDEFRLIDHTPGYGSVARYWAAMVQNVEEENRGSCPADPVIVLQAMGRKIGFIPAAARLADPRRQLPLLICLPEAGLTLDDLAGAVNDELRRVGRVIVIVSEGFDVGPLGEARDAFGHTEYGASRATVAQTVVNYLNQHGLAARGAARGQVCGTDQRHAAVYASPVDLDEAHKVGQQAVLLAHAGQSGFMATLTRRPGLIYSVDYGQAPLEQVAAAERRFPARWIAPSRLDVTDEFVAYARPLIGEDWVSVPLVDGRQRFARLGPIFAAKRCPDYVPQAHR